MEEERSTSEEASSTAESDSSEQESDSSEQESDSSESDERSRPGSGSGSRSRSWSAEDWRDRSTSCPPNTVRNNICSSFLLKVSIKREQQKLVLNNVYCSNSDPEQS